MNWEDEARRSAMDGDWLDVARLLVRAGYCRPVDHPWTTSEAKDALVALAKHYSEHYDLHFTVEPAPRWNP